MNEQGTEGYLCTLQLAPGGLTPEVKTSMTKYMKAYARASGWRMAAMKFKPGFIQFLISVSKAASSKSNKP
jgi:hypothetical protein